MKMRQVIIWTVFAVFLLTSVVVAGTVGLIDIGLDKDTEDKVTDIVGEKKTTEQEFIKESVTNEVARYEQQKIMNLRIQFNLEVSKCFSPNDVVRVEQCTNALKAVNAAYEPKNLEGEIVE